MHRHLLAALASRRSFLHATALIGAAASGWQLLRPASSMAEAHKAAHEPLQRRVLKGIARSKGYAEGEALVSEQPISWAPFAVPNDTESSAYSDTS